jgi:hypothetical protein
MCPLRADGAWASEFSLYAVRTPVSVWWIAKLMPVNLALPGLILCDYRGLSGVQMMKIYTSAHKFSRAVGSSRSILLALFPVIALGSAVLVSSAHAQSGAAAITCTNPASGATWQIHIDYDRHTVDSNPAVISDASIEWQESNGWKYTLDRKFGKLTVVLASSTGGNFLHDQCKLDK